MAKRRKGYDAACHYSGKLIGRCAQAESDIYVTLTEACDGSATRVLQEYTYFSQELRAILKKVAMMQENKSP